MYLDNRRRCCRRGRRSIYGGTHRKPTSRQTTC